MSASDAAQAYAGVAATLDREWRSVTSLLADLDEPSWNSPTRCHGWSLLDLAHHAVWGSSMEADAVRRARAGDGETAQGRVLPPDTGPAETLEALRRSTAALCAEVAALRHGDATLTCPMPHGPTPLPLALDIFVFEAGIHAGDFADAAGRDRPLAEDVAPVVADILAAFLPVFATAGTLTPSPGTSFSLRGRSVALDGTWTGTGLVVGDAGEVPSLVVTGDDSSVLLYALGRIGADDPRLTVAGSPELARHFKDYAPGP
jgi:uncharacterized protein (TIGR03083 family)